MSREPIFRDNVLVRADARRSIFELDSQQPRVLRHMKAAIAVFGKDDAVVPGLLAELAPPTLPAKRFIPVSARSHCSRYAVARANINPLIEDHRVEADMAGQIGARLRDQSPWGERFMLLNRDHRGRQRDLGAGRSPRPAASHKP
jgi:hypothetical protein